jgi:hypothetical protein
MYIVITVTGFCIAQYEFQLDFLPPAIFNRTQRAKTVQHDSLVDTQEKTQGADSRA